MTIGYTAADIVGISEDTLAIYSWNGTGWVEEDSSSIDKSDKTVSAGINHLSAFALLGEGSTTQGTTKRIYLPLIARESSGW